MQDPLPVFWIPPDYCSKTLNPGEAMRPNRKHRRRMARLARMRAIQEQMSAASLEDLVTACRHAYRRHDPRIVALTFAVLCAKVGKLIIWHVRRCRPNASDAELLDYAQELHAKLLTDIRTGQSETYAERNFRAYIYRRLLDILDKESTRFEARSKCVKPTETRDPIGALPSNDNLLEQTATLQAWMQRLCACTALQKSKSHSVWASQNEPYASD
jgi:hypothetical protein